MKKLLLFFTFVTCLGVSQAFSQTVASPQKGQAAVVTGSSETPASVSAIPANAQADHQGAVIQSGAAENTSPDPKSKPASASANQSVIIDPEKGSAPDPHR